MIDWDAAYDNSAAAAPAAGDWRAEWQAAGEAFRNAHADAVCLDTHTKELAGEHHFSVLNGMLIRGSALTRWLTLAGAS